MKRLNNKGFGATEILIIVVVIGLIGAVGWLVWNRNQNKLQKNETSNSDTTTTSQQSTDKESQNEQEALLSEDWLTHQSSSTTYNGSTTATSYSVKLPNGMTFISNPDGPSIFSNSEVNASSTEKATVRQSSEVSSGPEGLFLITSINDAKHVAPSGAEQTSLTTYNGVTVKKYTYDNSSQYILTKGEHALTITYTYSGTGSINTIEEMVKTAILN